MTKDDYDKMFANVLSDYNRALSLLEKQYGDLHQLSIETAQNFVAYAKKLSPHVLAEKRSFVTARDSRGAIMNTTTIEVPAHKRDFNAITAKQMRKFRSEATGLGRFYHDVLSAVWEKDAYARIQHLAAGPSFTAWIAQCDKWKVASSDYPDEPFTMRILRLTQESVEASEQRAAA